MKLPKKLQEGGNGIETDWAKIFFYGYLIFCIVVFAGLVILGITVK